MQAQAITTPHPMPLHRLSEYKGLVPTNLMKPGGLGAAVFKGLRDRLKKVSEQLEDELEAKLEAELEAELAGSTAASPEPEPSEAPPAETPAPRPATEEKPVPPAETPSGSPLAEQDSGRQVEETQAPPTTELDGGATQAREAQEDSGAATDEDDDTTTDEGAGAGPEAEGEPAAPTVPASPTASTAPSQPVESQEPAAPAAPSKPAEAPKPVYGRKILSGEEVEERLRRELGEAVEVQRDMERTVQETGAPATRYTINEDVLDDILWELELGLLESDVAVPVIEAIKANVREQLLSMSVGGRSPSEVVEKVLRSAVRRVLNVNAMDFDAFVRDRLETGKKPVVVMFVGVNGTGKTTSIARIAWRLQQAGISSVMAAGDTFRAGAIEQLATHGERLGIRVVKHTAGADPAAVAYDAIEHAKARHKDVVLLDTAGRMQTNTNLMDEMDKIRRVAKPDLVVFVGDSLAGNDAVEQARRFDEVVDIDGAILTKTDVDAKGGAALSVAYTINKPLLFIGVGQEYADLEPFSADKMVGRLFGDEP